MPHLLTEFNNRITKHLLFTCHIPNIKLSSQEAKLYHVMYQSIKECKTYLKLST